MPLCATQNVLQASAFTDEYLKWPDAPLKVKIDIIEVINSMF